MDPRTSYLSAFRGSIASAAPVQPPSVPSPVGAVTSQTLAGQYGRSAGPSAADQGRTLQRGMGRRGPGQGQGQAPAPAMLPAKEGMWEQLPPQIQGLLQQGYQGGGFGGIQQATENAGQDWYDIPEYVRTQLLAGARGGG